MLLFALKKCAFRPQIHQLVRHNICSKNLTKLKELPYWIKLNCPYLKNPNFIVYKLMHTNPASEKQNIPVPRLMWHKFSFLSFSITESYYVIYTIRNILDSEFNFSEFMVGAKQAITVISSALAEQNYEILDGMVTKRSLKLLKYRVDHLTPQQRKLLPINPSPYNAFHVGLVNSTDANKKIVEIKLVGYYRRNDYIPENSLFGSMNDKFLTYTYVFQRIYINGIGQPWMVKLISYGNFNKILKEFFSI